MATKKIKSDHPFTKKQLAALNKEVQKLTDVEITGMKGVKRSLPETSGNYTDIKVLHSPYILDVFLEFTDISDPDYPKFETYKIDANGEVDYFVKRNMEFDSLSDRVAFFNELMPVKFYY